MLIRHRIREYLKRDDQILVFRLQNEERRNRMATTAKDRDRALAQARPNELPLPDDTMDMEDDVAAEEGGGTLTGQDALGSKVIVIHPGSQNLRIGLASDALPKTVPMVIARKWKDNESEDGNGEPKPKRVKRDDGTVVEPEHMFGEEVWLTSSCSSMNRLMATNSLLLIMRPCALS